MFEFAEFGVVDQALQKRDQWCGARAKINQHALSIYSEDGTVRNILLYVADSNMLFEQYLPPVKSFGPKY